MIRKVIMKIVGYILDIFDILYGKVMKVKYFVILMLLIIGSNFFEIGY